MKKIPQKFRAPIRAMDKIFDNLTEGLQSHQEDEERFDAGEFCVQYQDGPWEAAEFKSSQIVATAFGVTGRN